MNPVLMLAHNNLGLTQRAVQSVYEQRIKTSAWVVDNGSKDATVSWAEEAGILLDASPFNVGVSAGWNHGLNLLFGERGFDHVLVVGNDVVLPEFFYSTLLSYNVPFVTGFAVEEMPKSLPERMPLTPNPDFSAFLIRREAWEKLGPFNESMKFYVQDCDMHVRAHRMGIELWKANCPFYHERSSTMRLAPPEEQREIQMQANHDREVFRSLYGVIPGDPGYSELFK